MKINYTLVKFENVNLKTREGEKLRGFFATNYADKNIMHNHSQEGFIFTYPKVQYKVIKNIAMLCGIENGAELISKIGFDTDEFVIDGKKISSFQKEIYKNKVEFGIHDDYISYSFITPWVSLNQKNIEIYKSANYMRREELLKKILIGNILSMSKGLGYTVQENLNIWIDLQERKVNIKNIKMLGFVGNFKVNFLIPDYLGIGKFVSRGFGTVKSNKM